LARILSFRLQGKELSAALFRSFSYLSGRPPEREWMRRLSFSSEEEALAKLAELIALQDDRREILVTTALPAHAAWVQEEQLPPASEEELRQVVLQRHLEQLPFPAEELHLELRALEKRNRQIHCLAIFAYRPFLAAYQKRLAQAGILLDYLLTQQELLPFTGEGAEEELLLAQALALLKILPAAHPPSRKRALRLCMVVAFLLPLALLCWSEAHLRRECKRLGSPSLGALKERRLSLQQQLKKEKLLERQIAREAKFRTQLAQLLESLRPAGGTIRRLDFTPSQWEIALAGIGELQPLPSTLPPAEQLAEEGGVVLRFPLP